MVSDLCPGWWYPEFFMETFTEVRRSAIAQFPGNLRNILLFFPEEVKRSLHFHVADKGNRRAAGEGRHFPVELRPAHAQFLT